MGISLFRCKKPVQEIRHRRVRNLLRTAFSQPGKSAWVMNNPPYAPAQSVTTTRAEKPAID